MKTILALVFLFGVLNATESEAKRLCNAEIKKEQPQKSLLKKQCSMVAKQYEDKKKYGVASWYYLLANKQKYNTKHIESKILKNGNFANVAHSYVLQNNLEKAKKNYLKFLKNADIPWADNATKDDYKLLFKLYPTKKEQLEQGLKLWNRIYKPLLAVNELYPKYENARKEKRYKEAIDVLKKIITLQKKSKLQNKIIIANNEYSLGAVYNYNKEYQKSLEVLQQVEKIYENEKSKEKTLGYLLDWIADSYKNLQKNKKAISYYQKSLVIKKKFLGKEHISVAESYNNIAKCYENIGTYSKALDVYKKLLKIYKIKNDSYSLITLYSKISKLYKKLGNKKQAIIWNSKSEKLDKIVDIAERKEYCLKGDKEECYSLAYEYKYDNDDLNNSEKYFKTLCNKDYIYKEDNEDVCFEYGDILEDYKQYNKAIEIYGIGCKANFIESCEALGQLHFNETNDYKKAEKYLKKVPIEKLSNSSLYYLSKIYSKGLGQDINYTKAKTYASLGCNKKGVYKSYACCRLLTNIKEIDKYNKNIDIKYKDKKGQTYLIKESYYNNIEIIKLLLDKGVDINAQDNKGATALMNASYKGHEKVVKLLLDKGANPNILTEDRYTALKYAIEQEKPKAVKLLLSNGADVNITDKKGQTPLIVAGYKNNTEIIKILLEHGSDINAQDKEGATALMNASYKGHKKIVKLLLEKGANPNILTKDRYIALKYAIEQKKSKVVELLFDNKATNKEDIYSALKFFLERGDLNKTIALSNLAIKDNITYGYLMLGHAKYLQGKKDIALENYFRYYFLDKNAEQSFNNDLESIKNIDLENVKNIKNFWKYSVLNPTKKNINLYIKISEEYSNIKAFSKLGKYFLLRKEQNLTLSKKYCSLVVSSKDIFENDCSKILKFVTLEKGELNDPTLVYEYAKYLEEDYQTKKSLIWYGKSAKLGYKKAIKYLADKYWKEAYYYEHYRKEKNFGEQPKKALFWNTVLAKKGDTEAQYRLGYIYCCGLDFKKDLKKSKYWFAKALSNKKFRVNYKLEDYVLEGVKNKVVVDDKWLYKYEEMLAEKYKKETKYKKALVSYRKLKNNSFFKKLKKYQQKSIKKDIEELEVLSFENNNTYIQNKYAKEYFDNKEYSLALRLYKTLYNKGVLDAGHQIGMIYLKGSKDIKKDYTLAKKWFEKLAKQNHIASCKSMALLYEKGYGVEIDNTKSKSWLKKAYDLEIKKKQYEDKIVNAIHNRDLLSVKRYLKEKNIKNMEFAICAATKDNSLDIVKMIVKEYPNTDLNAMCRTIFENYSLLFIASDLGYKEIVDYLLSKNVDSSDYSESSSFTPLEISLYHGHKNISLKLLNENKKSHNTSARSILYAASYNDINLEIVKEYSKNVDDLTDSIKNSFHFSAYKNFKYLMEKSKFKYIPYQKYFTSPINELKYIKIILKNNPKIESRYNLLRSAIYSPNSYLLKFYIDNNISIDAYRRNDLVKGKKDYLLSIPEISYDMMKYVLENSKVPKAQANSIFKVLTPPSLDLKKIKLLLKYGLDVNIKNKCGKTPLMFAKNKDVAKLLIKHGANVNAESKFSKYICGYSVTPLSALITNHWILRTNEHIDTLLDAGADINHTSSYTKETLLHFLLHTPDDFDIKIFNHLLDMGIDLNKVDKENNSPLSVALKKNNKEAAVSLLNHNAIITLHDFKMAIEHNQIDIFEVMLNKSTTINLNKILELTTKIGSATMSKMLFEKGVKIDTTSEQDKQIIFNIYKNKLNFLLSSIKIKKWESIRDKNGNTLLHQAIIENDIDTLNMLLSKGLGGISNKYNISALHLAIKNRMKKITSRGNKLSNYKLRKENNGESFDKNIKELYVGDVNNFMYMKIIKILLKDKKILEVINLKDNKGRTPLFYALKYSKNNEILIDLLLKHGALLDKKSKLFLAEKRDKKLMKIFKKYNIILEEK